MARARAAITNSVRARLVVAMGIAVGVACAAALTFAAPPPGPSPDGRDDAAMLYAEGRRYEDALADPVHALDRYERVVREHPDASVAVAAEAHAARLRALLAGGHAREAQDFAKLVAEADRSSPEAVMERGDALATTGWPGAPAAELWLADWLRRAGRFDAADARYARLVATWPTAPEAPRAASGRAGAAIDARMWQRARVLIGALPAGDPESIAVRDDLRAALGRGESLAGWTSVAWIALALAGVVLLGSLADAARRGEQRRRWPRLAPPVEIWFLGPIALVLAGVTIAAHQAIAPVVVRISIAGVALAWLSGGTLDLLRARGRAWKTRAVIHVIACTLAILAVGYLAVTAAGLVDLLR